MLNEREFRVLFCLYGIIRADSYTVSFAQCLEHYIGLLIRKPGSTPSLSYLEGSQTVASHSLGFGAELFD